MIDLYFWPTPNGKKVSILLEETGLPYRIVPLDIGPGEQLSPQYLALNPNHRMPAIVDNEPLGGGSPISVFESGAILPYIAEKAGRRPDVRPASLRRRGEPTVHLLSVATWVKQTAALPG